VASDRDSQAARLRRQQWSYAEIAAPRSGVGRPDTCRAAGYLLYELC
jgi:hypothetical protein